MIVIQNFNDILIFFAKFPVYVFRTCTYNYRTCFSSWEYPKFSLKISITEKINSVSLSFGQLLEQKRKILKSLLQSCRKEWRPTNKSEVCFLSFSYDYLWLFVLFSFRKMFSIQYYYTCIYFSILPIVLCFFLSMERKYSMKAMREFSLCFYFVPCKVNILIVLWRLFFATQQRIAITWKLK